MSSANISTLDTASTEVTANSNIPSQFASKKNVETENVPTDIQKAADLKNFAGEGLHVFTNMMRPFH